MALQIHNSMTREKEVFEPLQEGVVGIYICGPTVYGHCHIGHAKSYISFDVIVKWIRHSGYKVRYVQNITDVGHLTDDADEGEDKIERQAKLDQVHPLELVDTYMRSYFTDMEALHVAHPDMYVRATQHIGEQVELVQRLIERGHAYERQGNVYFDVSSWPDYGKLSGRKAEDQLEGARVAVRSDKKDPRDFALWKSAEGTGHLLRWNSPWGEGYPGWHVECSAMSMKYLGETFDIHGGGMENKFPHHECEIAQSCAGTDGTFARYWLHNNMINVDGQKMGKSLGNSIRIQEALESFRPEALRMFILSTHYARPSNYTVEGMEASSAGVDRIINAMTALQKSLQEEGGGATGDDALKAAVKETREGFTAAMDDDFNTPVAISLLFDFVKSVNTLLPKGAGSTNIAAAILLLEEFAVDLLGILPPSTSINTTLSGSLEPDLMQLLLDIREASRQEGNYATADLIRDRLQQLGVTIKDEAGGASWKLS